ncbi:quinoprotein relay system zinc metallohydrolase 2 [Variovorax sp. dw_308]|uniref:quinoprotein relay system zinc metallohydrolase 2 n=1 Tax=Variovorax sp. dw_308 TaxID=2721546 RepID=UPI00210D1D41|nr:quinoprotein relay system zinc metallohydrolase 2 [Variovorax sp. dw_308]
MPTFMRRWMRGLRAAILLCAAVAVAQAAGAVTPLAVVEVKPGLFVHTGALEDWAPANGGDVANLGFVVGSRCVAVIDTGGTPAIGQALKGAIDRVTPLPVCYVINTHAHPDHVLGNVAFAESSTPAPRFVASARFTQALTAREPYWLNSLKRDFDITLPRTAIVYPGISVDKTMQLDLGDRVLTLQAWPTAHTDNDLTVYDQRTRTLFASDLLFVRHLPALDGSLRGWVSVMEDLKRVPVDTVVPGHGPVSNEWPGAMDAQAAYLGALLRDTRAALRKHLTIQQAVDSIGIAPGTPWLLTDRFHKRNVTAAYAELEWEDPDTAEAPKASKP